MEPPAPPESPPPTAERRPGRRLGLGLAASLAGVVVAAGIGELGLRLAAPQPISWLSIYAPDEVLPYRLAPGVSQHVDTGETDWWVHVDAAGYRTGAPASAGPAAGAYLLGLGDSFAFGHGTAFEASLYGILDVELEGVRVRNAAVPGYGPEQYRQVLEAHLDDPELAEGLKGVLVTSFLGNDFHDGIWNKRRPITDGALGATAGRRYWLKKSSHLYRFLAARAHALGVGRGESDLHLNAELLTKDEWVEGRLAEALAIYERELERIRDLCREHDLPLQVVLLPARATVDRELCEASVASAGLADGDWQPDLPTQKAAATCGRLSIPCFETSGLLGQLEPPLYLRFDGHFRPETTRAVARAIVEHLLPARR